MAFDNYQTVNFNGYTVSLSDLLQNIYDGSNGNQPSYAYGGFRNINLGRYTIMSFFQKDEEEVPEDKEIIYNYSQFTQSSNVCYLYGNSGSVTSKSTYPIDGRTAEQNIYRDVDNSFQEYIPLLKDYRNVSGKVTSHNLANYQHINGLSSVTEKYSDYVDLRFSHLQSFNATLHTITINDEPTYEEPFKVYQFSEKTSTVNLGAYVPGGDLYDEGLWSKGYKVNGNTIEYITLSFTGELGLPQTETSTSRTWNSNLLLIPTIVTQIGNQISYVRLYSFLNGNDYSSPTFQISTSKKTINISNVFDFPRGTVSNVVDSFYQTLKRDTDISKNAVVLTEVSNMIKEFGMFPASSTWRYYVFFDSDNNLWRYDNYSATQTHFVNCFNPLSRTCQVLAISGLPYISGSRPTGIPVDVSLVDETSQWISSLCVGKTENSIYTGELLWGLDALEELKKNSNIKRDGYEPVYPSGGGGGGGSTPDPGGDENVDPSKRNGDNIDLNLSNRLATFNGFLTMYNMNYQQLANFGSALMGEPLNYRGNFEKDLSEELSGTYDVSSILNYIVSVKQYPFSVATLTDTTTNGTSNVLIGTGEFGVPIGSVCRVLTSSISVLYAGGITVAPIEPYNDFRDYYNTSVTAYLPYCGTVELNPMEIIGSYLQCYYLIDFLTGECTAVLYSTYNDMSFPVAIANGIIGIDVPLSATNSGQLSAVKRMENAQLAKTTISHINNGIQTVENLASFIGNAGLGNVEGALNSAVNLLGNTMQFIDTAYSHSANPYGGNKSARSAVSSPMMPTASGATNFMLPSSAYIQIRRGTYSRPDNYPRTMGYPNSYSSRLSNVSGLTVCHNVNISGINCTAEEKQAIKSALESGVIL